MSQTLPFALAAEAVKQQLDIVDTISRYVVLKKQGRNHVGLCPFHNDKKPSMQVSPSKQIFKCFSCGAGGDTLSFLMQLENKNYGEVIRELAEAQGISIASEQDNPQARQRRDTLTVLSKLLEASQHWYASQLLAPEGKAARAYLENRSVTATTMQQFQLGLAPESWDALTTYLLGCVPELAEQPELLETAGLASPRKQGNGYYDKFRNRLIVPIQDIRGRVVAFGGRALAVDQEPKYLNSPESPLYQKSRILYGLPQALASMRQLGAALLMEGYFDVIAAHQAGLTHAVATCGTALTEEQVRLLLRQGLHTLYLCFDMDTAGQKATLAAIEKVRVVEREQQQKLDVRVVRLPEGKDPDEFLRREDGLPLFYDCLEQAVDGVAVQLEKALEGQKLEQWQHRLEALYKVAPVLAGLALPSQRQAWQGRLVAELGLDAAALNLEVNRLTGGTSGHALSAQRPAVGASGGSVTKATQKETPRAISSLQGPYSKQQKPERFRQASAPPVLDDVPGLRRRLPPAVLAAEKQLFILLWVSEAAWYPILASLEPLFEESLHNEMPLTDTSGVLLASVPSQPESVYKQLLRTIMTLPAEAETLALRAECLMRSYEQQPATQALIADASFAAEQWRESLDPAYSASEDLLLDKTLSAVDALVKRLLRNYQQERLRSINQALRQLESLALGKAGLSGNQPAASMPLSVLSDLQARFQQQLLLSSSGLRSISQDAPAP